MYIYTIYIHTYITLHYITLHYITLHYITLHYITLHYITLHYITLHYITLHYITYIHIYIYTHTPWPCLLKVQQWRCEGAQTSSNHYFPSKTDPFEALAPKLLCSPSRSLTCSSWMFLTSIGTGQNARSRGLFIGLVDPNMNLPILMVLHSQLLKI